MLYRKLPQTDIEVSLICLGTMTYGEQNTEKEAHDQLDYAISEGVNFIDTAELYAVPVKPETQGLTEKYIGTWLKNRNDREKLIIASKAAGAGDFTKHIRKGPDFSPKQLREAVESSLKRLQTDYLDLYQLHWPERNTNFFGPLGYTRHSKEVKTNFKETLEELKKLTEEGKIKYIGISNETPWGLMEYIRTAEKFDLPKVVTIQNPYNLVNRVFEIGLSEMCLREEVGLLAYSPLAGGLLSGKYTKNQKPEKSRYTLFPNYFARYSHENTTKAIEKYHELAADYGLNTSQMSLAFINQQEFTTSNIIGATTMEQLKLNIDSVKVKLSEDIMDEIEKIHLLYPNPAP